MLSCLLVASALAGGNASATLSWTRGIAWLAITTPEGWHIAPDAPASLTVGTLHVEGKGDLSVLRFPIAAGPVDASLSFGVCANSGSACLPVSLAVQGTIAGTKGQLPFVAAAAPLPARAGDGAVTRILDFGAVWCPPCNMLAAEILHDPADQPLLAPYDVVTVDVDSRDSWELKNRYAVGGYPTVIAVDTEGKEVARLVGYPGEAATRAWIASLSTAQPLYELVDAEPSGSPADCAAVARRLAEAEHEAAARRWLAHADNGVDAHLTRLTLDGTPEDAAWLLANAPTGPWLAQALSTDPKLAPRALARIAELPPADGADVLAILADQLESPKADALDPRTLRAAAILLVRSTNTGDPEHDRANVTTLAELYADMGEPARAVALLDEYASRYPKEFTFDYAAARLLVDTKSWAEAEKRAASALQKAWGDQRLRAVQPLARSIAEQGRMTEALRLLDEVLASTPAPPDDLHVRTTRYVTQVQALRRELPASVSAAPAPMPPSPR